jgi:hypothetical protein
LQHWRSSPRYWTDYYKAKDFRRSELGEIGEILTAIEEHLHWWRDQSGRR